MNREEVLAASRKELRNQDVAEAEFLKQASKVAYQIGVLVCCLICGLQWAYTKTVNWGCWVVNFSIIGTVFLVKSIKMKKRHEIVLTVFYYGLTLFFAVGFCMSLRG